MLLYEEYGIYLNGGMYKYNVYKNYIFDCIRS